MLKELLQDHSLPRYKQPRKLTDRKFRDLLCGHGPSPSRDVPILIPETYHCVTLYSKGEFGGQMELRWLFS